jgi:3-oxoadipate enol-lactonase
MAVGRIQVEAVSYEIRGSDSPVVLLHGGALTGRTWDAQVALLEQRHMVVRYDARGHGESSTPRRPFAHYEDLRRLLSGLDIAPATLVGLSMGARTSIDLALAHPDLVTRLILVAPGISGMTFRDPFVLAQNERLATAAAAGDLAEAIECLLRMWVDGPQRSPDQVDQDVRNLCRELYTDTATRHGVAALRLMTELDAVHRVGELRLPVHAVVGDLDSFDIHGVVNLIGSAAPAASTLAIRGAAHMVNLERPAEFNRELIRILETT